MSVLDRFAAHPLRASPSPWPLLLANPQLIWSLLVPRLKLMRQQKMPVSKRIEGLVDHHCASSCIPKVHDNTKLVVPLHHGGAALYCLAECHS